MDNKKFSEIISDFIVSAKYEDIPPDVIKKAKFCLIDMLGVIIAAWSEPSSKILYEIFSKTRGVEESSVIVLGDKMPAFNAALINGAMAHSLELEDHHNHKRSLNHPGVTSIPAALALGERERVSGKDFLLSIILGYEIGSKISRAIKIGHLNLEKGFHESSVCGPFSAAAVAGKLLGLSTDQLANAFGICGSLASGSMEFKTNEAWTKRLQVGNANRNGILAAELAEKGFTGPLSVFEGKHGFFNSYCGKGSYNLDSWLEDLGRDWDIKYIQFKPYGCAGVLHSAVTAAKRLRDDNNILLDNVEKIIVYTSRKIFEEYATPVEQKIRPNNMVGAQFSLQYCVAAMLVKGQLLLEEFWDDHLADPVILSLSSKIEVKVDEAIDRNWPIDDVTIIECHGADGSVIKTRVDRAKGDLDDPVTEEELIDKFIKLASVFYSEKQYMDILKTCEDIEGVSDVNELIKLVV
ncbi:MmgE/PrpD family protein [Desulfitibacter alkalitolerans]|uniref:MmgE/PrpD family protein n=1 Tax=Desulfitibacter alkalitolerans TaxID=264641 RepID=UPI00048223DB|nr:MmgE/PrpD family protein [Desulfitibacter alkalitolerans]